MINISYEEPEILEGTDKASAFSNQSYPYNSLPNPRRFEELLYSVTKEQLGKGIFVNFDAVRLMSGVGEQGRDCALFTNGNSTGLIQCKKYDSNLSKEGFGREITKFVLYSLLEKKLIHDPASFNYFIAVSKGLVKECNDFITAFSTAILSEPALETWILYNLNKYVSLGPLKLDTNETLKRTLETISKLKVSPIIPADLDSLIETSENARLSQLFFQVKTVIDNREITGLRNDLKNLLSGANLDGTKIGNELSWGSISLKSEKNEFAEIPDSHIERGETAELFDWITRAPKTDKRGRTMNICLLAGNAGSGKTVILKDLYDRMVSTGMAVLGLKADKIASSSVKELQEKIGISVPIYEFIEACKQQFDTTVILIDQIDALSQSMSTDRSFLQVFKDLIEQYLYDKNVRIIVSVRIYDLHYDRNLSVYKDIQTVTVEKLTDQNVFEQLAKINIEQQSVPSKLLDILKTPNHLNVFSRIYRANNKSLNIINVQQLYQELWRQKITALPQSGHRSRTDIKELLYKIAQMMFSGQTITVSEFQLEDFLDELSYLESERLVKKEGGQIQFFHQTFYDFIFAKQFIENGKSLNDYIKENGQSLLIRSAVKMMINYQRDYNPQTYSLTLKSLFADPEISFHVKHLALSTLLFHKIPHKEEKAIVKAVASSSFYLCILFFQHGISADWFQFALEHNLLSALNEPIPSISDTTGIDPKEFQVIKDAAFFFLRNASASNYPGAWEYVQQLNDKALARNILYINQNWNNPITFQILESCTDFEQIDPFGYYHTLNNIAHVHEVYALNMVSLSLTLHHQKNNSDRDYQERQVLKTLAKKCPEKLADILLDAIINDFEQPNNDKKLIGDYHYTRVDLQDKESLTGNYYLYRLLGVCLKRCASGKPDLFLKFFGQHKHSRYKPLLRLLIFAMSGAEEKYRDQLFELFQYLLECGEIDYDSSLATEFRIVFGHVFTAFNHSQQTFAIDLITDISYKQDHIHYDQKRQHCSRMFCNYGLSKFTWMRKIPISELKKSAELWREFTALARRFGEYKERLPSGPVMAGFVGTPLAAGAYKKMNNSQWLASFKKYNGSVDRFDRHHLCGDIEEHSQAFKNMVKENPNSHMLELIRQAWTDPDVKPKYAVYGLWGWSESTADPREITPILKEIISTSNDPKLLRDCLYVAKQLVGTAKDEEYIVKFICEKAVDFKHEDPFLEDQSDEEKETSINGLITRGINTFDGSAAATLVHIQDPAHSDLVFSTIETVLEKGPKASRAAVYFQFAYLMNLDSERAFDIFLTALLREDDIYVIASAIWSIQYMRNHDFARLVPIFEKLVVSEKLGQEDSHSLSTIIYGSYLHSDSGADVLVKQLIVTNKYACNGIINDIIQHYYLIEGSKEKNNELLEFVLSKATEEDFQTLGWNFSASSHISLDDISPFLTQYMKSCYFKITDQLVEYLSYQCGCYPMLAIELFKLAIQSNKFENSNRQGIYSNDSGTKFIITAFNSLIKNDNESIAEREQLMKAFDLVLMDYRFRTDTDRLIDELL